MYCSLFYFVVVLICACGFTEMLNLKCILKHFISFYFILFIGKEERARVNTSHISETGMRIIVKQSFVF